MLPLSKFAFLPEKINIDVAKSGGKGTIHMKYLYILCKRTLHTIQLYITLFSQVRLGEAVSATPAMTSIRCEKSCGSTTGTRSGKQVKLQVDLCN